MGTELPPLSAYFQNEDNARAAAELLEVLFATYLSRTDELDGQCWLLTVVLPDIPSLSTFYMDTALMTKVEEIVEGYGGEVWDPEVLAEIHRRLAEPTDTWAAGTHEDMLEAAEREDPIRDESTGAIDEQH